MTKESILVSVKEIMSYEGMSDSISSHLEQILLQFRVSSQHSFLVRVFAAFLGDFFWTNDLSTLEFECEIVIDAEVVSVV